MSRHRTPASRRTPAPVNRFASGTGGVIHPATVPIVREDASAVRNDDVPDLGAELRERIVSEMADRRYVERGVDEGDDVEHVLEAEIDIERQLVAADKPSER